MSITLWSFQVHPCILSFLYPQCWKPLFEPLPCKLATKRSRRKIWLKFLFSVLLIGHQQRVRSDKNMDQCLSHFQNLKLPSCGGCAQPETQPHQVYQETGHICFSSGILVTSTLMCSIAVSYGPVVCGFSSFLLTVLGKRRSFTVLQYYVFVLSCLNRSIHCAVQNTVK